MALIIEKYLHYDKDFKLSLHVKMFNHLKLNAFLSFFQFDFMINF